MNLHFPPLDSFPAADWLLVLNDPRVRRHLVPHPAFTGDSVARWLQSKLQLNHAPGHWIRAVSQDGHLAGWCGIQQEAGAFGLALVLRPSAWGLGPRIVKRLLAEAALLGHAEVALDLFPTRPLRATRRLKGRSAGCVHLAGYEFNRFLVSVTPATP